MVPYSSSSQSRHAALKNLLADGRADCVEVEWLQNFRKILIPYSVKFSSNFAKFKIILSKFREMQNFHLILNFAKLKENFINTKLKIT